MLKEPKISKCPKCSGGLDPIKRGEHEFFLFCRACKLPFNNLGRTIIDTKFLNTAFNPTRIARSVSGKSFSDMAPVAKTALEGLLIEALMSAYSAGLKDGILLAYSQDVHDSKPVHDRTDVVK